MSRKSMLSSSSCSRKRHVVVELRQIFIGRDVAQNIQNFFSDFSRGHAVSSPSERVSRVEASRRQFGVLDALTS